MLMLIPLVTIPVVAVSALAVGGLYLKNRVSDKVAECKAIRVTRYQVQADHVVNTWEEEFNQSLDALANRTPKQHLDDLKQRMGII